MSDYYNGQYPYRQDCPLGMQPGSGWPQQGTGWPQDSWTHGWFALNEPGYVKGLILGAGLTYILTNPKVQRAMVKGAVALWTSVQGGFEEVKEQIQDIKSEMSMKKDEPKS